MHSHLNGSIKENHPNNICLFVVIYVTEEFLDNATLNVRQGKN